MLRYPHPAAVALGESQEEQAHQQRNYKENKLLPSHGIKAKSCASSTASLYGTPSVADLSLHQHSSVPCQQARHTEGTYALAYPAFA
jgi:hypothetical protein